MDKTNNLNEYKVSERYKEKYRDIDASVFSLTPPLPTKGMTIEVTNRCNNNCIFCFQHKMTIPKHDIDKQFAMRMLEEAYRGGKRSRIF